MISAKRKFLFFHVPKTGGNSIQKILSEYSDDKIVLIGPHQDGIERFKVRNECYPITKHSTLRDYKKYIANDVFHNLYKFATNRNPWDMMVSFYFSPHRNTSKWCRDDSILLLGRIKTLRQYISINEKDNIKKEVDYLKKCEKLNEEFSKVGKLLNIPNKELPVCN